MKAPFKCNKCGAPIELDPYKDFVKCSYCGSTNIFENGKLISKRIRYLNKVGEYLPKLKQKKVFIPLIIFSILVPFGIYKLNYIDDFLVKECQQRDARRPGLNDFIRKKNYRKCLKNIKAEYKSKLEERKKYIKKSCSIENQKRYTKLLYEPAFDPEEYPIGPEVKDNCTYDGKLCVDVRKLNYEQRKLRTFLKKNKLEYFKPPYIKDLPWSKKKSNEFFNQKECQKILEKKHTKNIF